MTDQQLARERDTRDYLGALTTHLYRQQVRGPRIGEILAEVEAHVAATGESARAAFGPPEAYAREWATPVSARERWRRRGVVAVVVAVSAAVGAIVATAAVAAGRGTTVFGLDAWWVLVPAIVAVLAALVVLPLDRVVDPRTGRPRSAGRVRLVVAGGAVLLGIVVVLVVTGAWSAAA